MRKKIAILSCSFMPLFLISVLLLCDVAVAGPLVNTQQFQQKAAKTAVRGASGVSSQPKPVIEQSTEEVAEQKPSEEKPAEEKPLEEEKIKIEISEKEIDARVPSYKKSLKDIIRDADANIKKIDDQLKAEDDERAAKEHYDKGNAFYTEEKFEEAGKEWNAALGLAKELEFRKRIRGSLKRAARQIREAKDSREAEECAKKKAKQKEDAIARRENTK